MTDQKPEATTAPASMPLMLEWGGHKWLRHDLEMCERQLMQQKTDDALAEVQRLGNELADARNEAHVLRLKFQESDRAGTVEIRDAEIASLRAKLARLTAKLSHRRCWACGNEDYYTDATLPACACSRCGSADTRLIRASPAGEGDETP